MKARTKSRIAFGLALALLLCGAGVLLLLQAWRSAANTPPSPGADASVAAEEDPQSPFPEVDWDYWQGVNPDVIGWITVPGTTINSPIVQAPVDDPGYYLKHDVYRNYNPHGAIYLDADCQNGLLSRNAVIMGHHYGDDLEGAPFGIIAEYKDEGFAAEHALIYLQTPEWKKTFEVRFAQIVNGLENNKFTSFGSDGEFRAWYDAARDDAAMVLDAETEPDNVISLVSCSYNIWVANERTVLVASEKYSTKTDGNAEIPQEAS
jgi:sortase B